MTSSQRKRGELAPKSNCWAVKQQEHSSRQATKNAVSSLEEEVGEREGYKVTSAGLGDTEEVRSPCMSWPCEKGQLAGGCSSRDCSQSSLDFPAYAPPYFLGNRNIQLSRRPEMLILGFLWSEAGLPNLWFPSKDTTLLLSGSQPCSVLCS